MSGLDSQFETRALSGPLSSPDSRVVLNDPLTGSIAVAISKAIEDKFGKSYANSFLPPIVARGLTSPPNPSLGDYAWGCFNLGKLTKRSPAACASELAAALKDNSCGEFVACGPYLNVRINDRFLRQTVLKEINSGDYFARRLTLSAPKTMVEFSQPNTHKELHVGHMRNICLGDALTKCLRYVGVPVISATFPGDVGAHVAKCLWFMRFRNTEPVPDSDRGTWLGAMYSRASLQLEKEKGTSSEAENEKVISSILHEIEAKSGSFYELWRETREWSIELLESAYRWAEITFDRWYWESEVDSSSVAFVKELKAKGAVAESEGALGVDLSNRGLGFCLLLKSDGNGLYATKDLMLAYRKFQDFGLDKSLYLVDLRQTFHFQQVFAALEAIGFEHARDCHHLAYNFVELPNGAMSSRKGNIIPLRRLIESMEATIKERYLLKYLGQWAQAEIDATATIIAGGAIKFGMNQVEPGSKIVFDLEQWLRLDGNSGPYVQYACARLSSLIRKSEPIKIDGNLNLDLLVHPQERGMLVTLNSFNDVVLNVAETMKTNQLCDYLLDVARSFAGYYSNIQILDDANLALTAARIELCKATFKILKTGLGLLGISVPDRM